MYYFLKKTHTEGDSKAWILKERLDMQTSLKLDILHFLVSTTLQNPSAENWAPYQNQAVIVVK